MNLPTREQAEDYFEDFHVPDNFLRHCLLVNKVAVFFAEELKARGEAIDLDIVDRLSLLHDLFKPITIKNLCSDAKYACYPTEKQIDFWKTMKEKYAGKHETDAFYIIFKDEFPEFAALMKHYGNHDILTSKKSREEQIVHYADWRVYLDTILSLKERTDNLFVRYKAKIGTSAEEKEKWKQRVADEFAVEESIFKKLQKNPDELKRLIVKTGTVHQE